MAQQTAIVPRRGIDATLLDPPETWQTLRRRLRHRLKLEYYWRLVPHRPYQPLFVLATGRSGSTMLTDLLRGLPGVDCGGEVLHHQLPIGLRLPERYPARAIRHIRKSLQAMHRPLRGCKLMMYQLQFCQLSVEQLDAAFPGAKYLILYRESIAEQFVSHHCARVTNQWVLKPGEVREHVKIRIDPEELKTYCLTTRRSYEELLARDWLRERALLFSYEQLVADRRHWFTERICPFLGVPAVEPATQLVKQGAKNMADRVINYHEVADLLSGPMCHQRHAWPGEGHSGTRAA